MESTAFDITTSGKIGTISTFLTEEQPVKNKAAIAINEYFFIGIVKIMIQLSQALLTRLR